jgi:hypothetical protein
MENSPILRILEFSQDEVNKTWKIHLIYVFLFCICILSFQDINKNGLHTKQIRILKQIDEKDQFQNLMYKSFDVKFSFNHTVIPGNIKIENVNFNQTNVIVDFHILMKMGEISQNIYFRNKLELNKNSSIYQEKFVNKFFIKNNENVLANVVFTKIGGSFEILGQTIIENFIFIFDLDYSKISGKIEDLVFEGNQTSLSHQIENIQEKTPDLKQRNSSWTNIGFEKSYLSICISFIAILGMYHSIKLLKNMIHEEINPNVFSFYMILGDTTWNFLTLFALLIYYKIDQEISLFTDYFIPCSILFVHLGFYQLRLLFYVSRQQMENRMNENNLNFRNFLFKFYLKIFFFFLIGATLFAFSFILNSLILVPIFFTFLPQIYHNLKINQSRNRIPLYTQFILTANKCFLPVIFTYKYLALL